MSRPFHFKQFSIVQEHSAHKVGTDGVLLGAWANIGGAQSSLDVGTGTGVIALMMAQRSAAHVTALEPDNPSFEEARRNAAASPWSNRVAVEHSTLQAYAAASNTGFDLLISNPPYFVESTKSGNAARDAARHTDGLPLARLAADAFALANRLAVVLPVAEGQLFLEEANAIGWHLHRTLEVTGRIGKRPERLLMELGKTQVEVTTEQLTIESAPRVYTDAYRELTKAFYLNF